MNTAIIVDAIKKTVQKRITSTIGTTVTSHEFHDVSNYQQFVCSTACIDLQKVNIKAHIDNPLWVESTSDRWIPLTKGQWCRMRFHTWRHHRHCAYIVGLTYVSTNHALWISLWSLSSDESSFNLIFMWSHWSSTVTFKFNSDLSSAIT